MSGTYIKLKQVFIESDLNLFILIIIDTNVRVCLIRSCLSQQGLQNLAVNEVFD